MFVHVHTPPLGHSIVDQCQDHTVQVDEETQQVEAEFDHGLFHVGLEQASVVYLSRVEDSHIARGDREVSVEIPGCNGQVEQQDEPVQGDQHQDRDHAMAHQLRQHPLVQLGAACPGVDIIAFQI